MAPPATPSAARDHHDRGDRSNRARANRHAAGPLPAPAPTALLLVDLINPLDFDGARAFHAQVDALAANIVRLKQACAAQGVPAIYVNDRLPGMPWRSDFAAMVDHAMRARAPAAQMVATLAPQPADHTIFKPRHSAFYGTPLQLLLTQMQTRRLVICGIATDSCVQFSAMDAYERGFELWIPGNCSVAQTRERHTAALAWMARTLRARVARSTGRTVVSRA